MLPNRDYRFNNQKVTTDTHVRHALLCPWCNSKHWYTLPEAAFSHSMKTGVLIELEATCGSKKCLNIFYAYFRHLPNDIAVTITRYSFNDINPTSLN